jgi:hypothetical protein
MHPTRQATLETVRFGEFLLHRNLISDEQWLAALAAHWSSVERRRIGATIVENGFLSADQIEAEARAFHEGIEVVEIEALEPRSERVTVPMPRGRS